VLELAPTRASVIACHASAEAADTLMSDDALGDADVRACRIAPDEVMLIGAPERAEELLEAVVRTALAVDPDSVVLDATDGWAVWTVRGEDAHRALGYLSAIELRDEGFVQGDVAHVPAKVVAPPDRLGILVPAMWGEHLRERILADCSPLGIRESSETVLWTAPARGSR
jgi:hypothetical protein